MVQTIFKGKSKNLKHKIWIMTPIRLWVINSNIFPKKFNSDIFQNEIKFLKFFNFVIEFYIIEIRNQS